MQECYANRWYSFILTDWDDEFCVKKETSPLQFKVVFVGDYEECCEYIRKAMKTR